MKKRMSGGARSGESGVGETMIMMIASADDTRTIVGATTMTASGGVTATTKTVAGGIKMMANGGARKTTTTIVSADATSAETARAVLKTTDETRNARGIVVGVGIPSARGIGVGVGVGIRRGGIGGSMMMIGSGDIDLFDVDSVVMPMHTHTTQWMETLICYSHWSGI
jgi:hypothetical protein